MNRRLPACFAALVALFAQASARAQIPHACDAAWPLAEVAPIRLVRLDRDARAVLVAGSHVLARVDLRDGASLQGARDAGERVQATIAQEGAKGWRVTGAVAVDDECTIDVAGVYAVGSADAAVARSVAALTTFGRAQHASAQGQSRAALDLTTQALEQLGAPRELPALAVTLGAFAAERAIDQSQFARARQILDPLRPLAESRLDRDQPAVLRFELASARLLPWVDALPVREALASRLLATFGARGEPTLDNRVRFAGTLVNLNRPEAALAEFDAVEALVRDDPRPLPVLRYVLARNHANTLSLFGRHEDQLVRLRALRARLMTLYGADDSRIVDIDADIARGLGDAGRLPEAIAVASNVYLWRARVLGATHPRTNETVQVLATLYGRTGRFGTARALLENLLRTVNPAANLDLGIRVRRDLATWMAMDGEPAAALDLMREAYETSRARSSENSLLTIGIAIDYGWLLLRAGEPRPACELLEAVRPHAPPANGLREFADAGLARCLLAQPELGSADAARALDLLRDAAAAAARLVGVDNPRALVWQSLLAGAELRTGDRAEAKRLLETFLLRAERNRAALAVGSTVRDSTFGLWIAENDSMAGYRTLAWLHAQDGDLDAAMRVAELARDRQLRDRFAERRWARVKGDVPEITRLRALQARRQGLDEAIAVAEIAQRVRLEAERVEVGDAADRLERELTARYPDAASPVTPTVAAVQARLGRDTALVAYQRAGDTWWAMVIERETARIVPILDSPHVAVAARAWARAVRGEPVRVWAKGDEKWVLAFVRPADALARVPITEVEQRLGGALFGALQLGPRIRRLVVVADDELIGLPLDALAVDGKGTPAAARFEIAHAASFGGWLELRDRTAARGWPRDLFALGAVGSDAPGSTTVVAGAPAASERARQGGWAPLPYARSELERIARYFPRDRVRVLVDGAATKSALLAASASGELAHYRFVHFATHGFVEPVFAERATLVLAAADGGDAELTATELAGLEMNAELVVLSACDSGVGRYEPGQGLLGFAFAALAAGNRGAVLSLWPVNDATTEMFMAGFYRRLRAGDAPSAALAATKREFMRSPDPRKSDRRLWSAFLLYGGS